MNPPAYSIQCPRSCGWSVTLKTYGECGQELVKHVKEAHGMEATFDEEKGALIPS